jgi:hypothetical protein
MAHRRMLVADPSERRWRRDLATRVIEDGLQYADATRFG